MGGLPISEARPLLYGSLLPALQKKLPRMAQQQVKLR